ncbi:MAG TPA: hypothetical protein VJ385_08110 [Fibrobacteria bacterium]|nr:hypothetical protein [Fibrobacteria bacterium]
MATLSITWGIAGLLALGVARASEGNAVSPDAKTVKPAKAVTVGKAAFRAKAASVPAAPGAGKMQVEEPKAAAPLGSARESKAWQKNHARGLTEAQRQAFRDRKEKMEGMIAVIKEKRMALASAKPEERAAIARELHTLMLEKDPVSGSATARVAPDIAPAALKDKAPGKEAAKKSEAAEARRRQSEWHQKQERKGPSQGD